MRPTQTYRTSSTAPTWRAGLGLALALALALVALPASAQVSYYAYGRVTSVHVKTAEVESSTTSSMPGVVVTDPEPAADPSAPVPLPGVTVEAYDAATSTLLGKGRANRQGYYNLGYDRPAEANHTVRFLLFLDVVDGPRELIGAVEKTPAGQPIVVNNRLFSYDIEVENDEAVHGGKVRFAPGGEFVFTEVGDVDMDDIFDQQADAGAGASLWGLTKPPSAGHSLGPHLAFGATLELYGLFGAGTGPVDQARYYRIHYSGPDTGFVCDPLYKKSYVIVSSPGGSTVEVYRTKLGPISLGADDCFYELDERLAGEPIPGAPGRFYSPYWTELSLRAKWNTRGLTDGAYTLSVEARNVFNNPLPASGNDFATLNLQINNTAPEATIHTIRHLNGDVLLSSAEPCQTAILNTANAHGHDDSLRLEITARHPDDLLRGWQLAAWHGNDQSDGPLASDSYTPPAPVANRINHMVDTPSSVTYKTCAYRFRLRVWPRITNGYHLIYIRDANWYVSVSVLPVTP